MKYRIGRVLHQLYSYRKQYLIIWAELLTGLVILGICTNKLLTNRELLQDILQSIQGEKMLIQYEQKERTYAEPMIPITYEQYEKVKEEFADRLDLSWCSISRVSTFYGEQWEEHKACSLVFMDDSAFAEYFETERSVNTAYVGEQAAQFIHLLQQQEEVSQELSPALDLEAKDEMLLWQGDECVLQPLPESTAKEILTVDSALVYFEEDRCYLEDCVILPADWMKKLEDIEGEFVVCQSVLSIGQAKEEGKMIQGGMLAKRLGELNPRFAYRLNDQYLNLQKQKTNMDWLGLYWLRISIVVLLLVGGSLTGILLVLLYERRRMKAIAFVCGATSWQVELETLAELSVLFAAALIPGILISRYLCKTNKLGMIPLAYYPESSLVLAGAAVLILAAVYLITGVWEHQISYVRVLKGE